MMSYYDASDVKVAATWLKLLLNWHKLRWIKILSAFQQLGNSRKPHRGAKLCTTIILRELVMHVRSLVAANLKSIP